MKLAIDSTAHLFACVSVWPWRISKRG